MAHTKEAILAKLCVDCKYYENYGTRAGIWRETQHWCTYNTRQNTDIVTGELYEEGGVNCYDERAHDPAGEHCGVMGQFWESKND